LYEYYADTHGDKSRDLKSLGTYEDGDDAALFSVFYDSLKHLRDLHRSGAGVSASVVKVEKKTDFRDVEPKGFSGEEFSGKFVDLNILHLRFLNLPKESGAKVSKKRKRMSYLNYLKSFADFENLGLLKNNEYISYLKALLDYLADFHQRINPLYPVEKIHKTLEEEFEKITVDDERIKLFCLSCNKQFAKDTVYNAHLLGNKHLKNTKNYLEKKAVASNSTIPNDTVPLLEFKIYYFRELLQERILATIQFVESIQTKTYSEILSERTNEPDAEEESEHESDDEQAVYNPLKIPLGWDGKPIPYWLYKLHGLNIEYKCEICGDFSYWGRKLFLF
jgi:splicing factor 3A subunit 3